MGNTNFWSAGGFSVGRMGAAALSTACPRPANNRETAEQDRVSRERERQQSALLNYSIADARRAAREGGGMK